ncbi:MAG: UDP-glucose 4-epimerase GalE [Brumimicrobium sp.]|nr:UDP-glucose 4-epimerase GalE [Brumimicrobium sp.]
MESKGEYILVTGGAGYIGSHTVISLLENGYTPIIIDDFRNSNRDVIARLQEITGQNIIYYDLACQEKIKLREVFTKYKVQGVIHFAAYKAVGESVEKPLMYFENNLGSLITLLELIQEFQITNLVFSSSCTVYGNPTQIPVVENSPLSFNSPYGYTKKVSEEIITQFIESFPTTKATFLRYFNPIGAHDSGIIGEEPGGKPNNLLPFITQTAIGIREKLTVFGDDYNTEDGTCVRDYIHVCDLAEAHVAALKKAYSITENPIVYNIGTGKGSSVMEMISVFEKVSHLKLPYTIGPRRSGDVPIIFANTDKANKNLEWKASRSIEQAIDSAWKFEKYIRTKRNNS